MAQRPSVETCSEVLLHGACHDDGHHVAGRLQQIEVDPLTQVAEVDGEGLGRQGREADLAGRCGVVAQVDAVRHGDDVETQVPAQALGEHRRHRGHGAARRGAAIALLDAPRDLLDRHAVTPVVHRVEACPDGTEVLQQRDGQRGGSHRDPPPRVPQCPPRLQTGQPPAQRVEG